MHTNKTKNKTTKWADEHNQLKIKALKVVLAKEKGYTKKSWFISNLYEAYRSYESMIEHILNNPEWEPNILETKFREIYWHTNLTYNSRNATMRQIHKAIRKDEGLYYKWLDYPKDITFEHETKQKKPTD